MAFCCYSVFAITKLCCFYYVHVTVLAIIMPLPFFVFFHNVSCYWIIVKIIISLKIGSICRKNLVHSVTIHSVSLFLSLS